MSNKEIALNYLRKGLSVIPLKSPSMVRKDLSEQEFIRQCKMPLVGWKEYQSRRPTEEEVAGWFDKWPDANIGIVTGAVSESRVLIWTRSMLLNMRKMKAGFQIRSKSRPAKGIMYTHSILGFEVTKHVKKDLDIDIRADGGYVVAPPSIHGNGNQYAWD